MRIIKNATAVLMAAFVAMTAICLSFGKDIRDALSPKVSIVFPEYYDLDGQMYSSVPANAVIADETGCYMFVAEESKKYPERCYVSVKKEIFNCRFIGDKAIIPYSFSSARVIIGEVYDGQRVVF